MARLLTEGFEMGDAVGWTLGAGSSVSTTQKRSGAYALFQSNARSTVPVPASSELYARVAIRLSSIGDALGYHIIGLYEGTTAHLDVHVNASGFVTVYRGAVTLLGTGTIALSVGSWYLIELHAVIHDTAGVVATRVDGIPDINVTGIDTRNAGTGIVDTISVAMGPTASYYDDIAVNDTSGTVDNSWCGEGRIIALKPNANGDSAQFTGSDGNSVDNYLLVDEVPSNGDTDYVETSTVDAVDLYNLEATGLIGVTINRVWAEARARATVGDGTGKVRLGVKTGGTAYYDAADNSLLTTFTKRVLGDPMLINPQTGVAWTVTDLDALQVGVKAR